LKISLHPKFYKPTFFWDVKSAPNYIKKLISMGIATTTLVPKYFSSTRSNCSIPSIVQWKHPQCSSTTSNLLSPIGLRPLPRHLVFLFSRLLLLDEFILDMAAFVAINGHGCHVDVFRRTDGWTDGRSDDGRGGVRDLDAL
jgi:hypothetical protein